MNKNPLGVGTTKLLSLLILGCLTVVVGTCLAADLPAKTRVYFSPNGGCQDAVIATIDNAKETIDIAMYYLTAREIAQTLVKAQERKVKVRIVLDQSQETQKYSKSHYLIKEGVDARYHVGPGLMHNKFVVIDGKILITGSFNWTPTADQKNEENMLIINDKKTIEEYAKRFEYLWKGSRKGEFTENQMLEKGKQGR